MAYLRRLKPLKKSNTITFLLKVFEPLSYVRFEDSGKRKIKPRKGTSLTEGEIIKGTDYLIKSLNFSSLYFFFGSSFPI